MLQRIQEQQSTIGTVLKEDQNTHLIPNSKEWDTIDGLIKPFQKATEAMSGEKHSTISTVKPLFFQIAYNNS